MDTKWKNIKSKAKSFLEKCWLSSTGIAVKLFCFVLAGFGIAFWYSVVVPYVPSDRRIIVFRDIGKCFIWSRADDTDRISHYEEIP